MPWPRLRDTIAIVALLLIALSVPGFGRQGRRASGLQQDLSTCISQQLAPEARITACDRIIAAGRFDGTKLAYIYGFRGMAYGAGGDYDRAIADFNEAMRIDPTNPASFLLRGQAYQRQGKLEQALADLIEAQRLGPDDKGTAVELARVRALLAAKPHASVKEASSGDLKALQQRLTSDGCYHGALDAQPSPALDAQPSPALDAAIKACPMQDPLLRIETGRHTASVLNIATDAQCRILATTSSDKTTRVWSAKDLHLLRTLRVPIDKDKGGTGYAVAVSPDGHYVATAGWDAQIEVDGQAFVYVFDATTGALVARPFASFGAVTALAFSPDGRWLAVAGGEERSGVRVYDTSDWHLAMNDLAYGHKHVYALAFGPDGSFYTAGFDGRLRRYGPGPAFSMQRDVAIQGGSNPATIAADPRGEFVVVGFFDTTALPLFEAATLRLRFSMQTRNDRKVGFEGVSWNADGSQLFVGGIRNHQDRSTGVVAMFDRTGRQAGESVVSDNALFQLRPCGEGVAISGAGVGVVDRAGKVEWSPLAAVDMRGKRGNAFTISPDARQMRFGLKFVQTTSGHDFPIVDPVVFDLSQGTLGAAPDPIPGFVAAQTSTLSVNYRLPKDEQPNTLATQPDRSGFVVGTRFGLHAFGANASELWEFVTAYETWGLNISADGRIVVAADDDGTIRWHRWSDGRELLALFVDKQTKRWVAWTPKGYYMASPGGEDLIGWQINRGWDQAADFFPASRFRTRFNRPDIVRLVLDTLDEDAAIKQANAAAGRTEDAQPLIAQLPPLIRVLDPAGGAHVPDGRVTIGYSFRSPSGLPVDRIVVTIDGRPVKEVGLPVHSLSGDQETKGSVAVPLGTRESDVGLIAWSGDRSSQAAHVDVVWEGAPATTAAQRKLYALVVGVGDYADADMKLTYAAKDARDFAKALTDQQGLYYGAVQTRVLTDREVTRASMSDGLAWLKQVATSPDDVSILFLAGHGLTDAKGTYWFFPADADADTMSAKGVSQEAMRQAMQDLKGKVLWFLDTCHAGAAAKRAPVDVDRLLNTVTAAENGGIVVFASSTGLQVSVESKDLGNGAFTKALVEGIAQGKAASFDRSKVTTSSLDGFLEQTVSQLTGGQQTPVMERPPQEHDFTIAAVRK